MLRVKLLDDHKISANMMASHAGRICYKSDIGDIYREELLDVENQLFKKGHHTTFEHQLFNFEIDGIAISDVTLGLHLTIPFYNSDQRSGRYSKMFSKPNFNEIQEYIVSGYGNNKIDDVMNFIKFSYSIFFENIGRATSVCFDYIKQERIEDAYTVKLAKKIAQEQLRNVVSTSFDSGLLFSIDIPTLVAMYECPSNPVIKNISDMMKLEFLKYFPEMSYIFRENQRELGYEKIMIESCNDIFYSPINKLVSYPSNKEKIVIPNIRDMIPVDKVPYRKRYMSNNILDVKNEVEISLATMGQDQRHRTILRSNPVFTGNFYSPPILQALNIEDKIYQLMSNWRDLYNKIDNNLFYLIAPYGAMVRYIKKANINALAHEQLKRLCWRAQEEIYNVNRILREELNAVNNNTLLQIFLPPCMKEDGVCYEGNEWCRRKIKDKGNPCPIREI